jgi:thiosulfate/3-mercaptopyruvate sulfurtransferase
MPTSRSPLIKPHEISFEKGNVIVDTRSGPDAFERYRTNHVKGALHADLDKDLSKKPADAAVGGRHPLPDINEFGVFLGKLGITPSTHVIIYDDKAGANAAARFWWMLRSAGHENVHVVDGGLDAIVRAGLPMSSEIPQPVVTTPYSFTEWKLPTVTIDEVKAAVKDENALVIDVREAYRYRGEREPIDLVAGHIPGAINIPYIDNLTETGGFHAPEELASLYKKAIGTRKPENVIVHCGSGVTACHTLLALEHAGISGTNLYVGSWSEWSRNDLPIGTTK